MVLSGELDMSKWRYVNDSRLADAFLDLIGIIASHEWRECLEPDENKAELFSFIKDDIKAKIELWAEHETEFKEGGMSTLL